MKASREATIAEAERVLQEYAGRDDVRLEKELAKLGWTTISIYLFALAWTSVKGCYPQP